MQKNKVMLITGTSKGIGRYLARYYAEKGFVVIGCSRGTPEESLKNYEHFALDVTDEAAVKKMFSAIRSKYGRLDVLINNAGIASMNHSLLMPLKTAQEIVNTNLIGSFLFSREAAKLMKIHKTGRIVNFATIAIPLKLEGEAVYAASKAAIITLTHVLAKEFAEFGITINVIGPTLIQTDLVQSVPEEKINALLQRQTIRRRGEFQDISNVIDFFIRPESDFITGQTLYLGGV